MKQASLPVLLTALLVLATSAWADRIELNDGSVINGRLVSAEGGKLKVETAFAGTIEIAQAAVKTFSTEESVNVSLTGGSTALGKVSATDAGIKVEAATGPQSSATTQVLAVWRQGADSPETRAAKETSDKLKHQWKFEAGVAISGRTGGDELFSSAVSFKATRENAQDKLILAMVAEKATDSGVDTADRQLASGDYSAFFNPTTVWYARTSGEKDAIKQLDFRSTSAAGMGWKAIKKDLQDLELRLGVSYTFESYASGDKFDSPGLDLGLIHSYQFKNGKLSNSIAYTPAFKDFANYRIHHESTFEMPITASLWKLKLGLTNDYISIPQPGVARLDTLYFTSLILNWQ